MTLNKDYPGILVKGEGRALAAVAQLVNHVRANWR